jgi:hypothetical protein
VPAHVVRFGEQDEMQGLIARTPGAERAVGYLCKYLTKPFAGTANDDPSPARVAHRARLTLDVYAQAVTKLGEAAAEAMGARYLDAPDAR